ELHSRRSNRTRRSIDPHCSGGALEDRKGWIGLVGAVRRTIGVGPVASGHASGAGTTIDRSVVAQCDIAAIPKAKVDANTRDEVDLIGRGCLNAEMICTDTCWRRSDGESVAGQLALVTEDAVDTPA